MIDFCRLHPWDVFYGELNIGIEWCELSFLHMNCTLQYWVEFASVLQEICSAVTIRFWESSISSVGPEPFRLHCDLHCGHFAWISLVRREFGQTITGGFNGVIISHMWGRKFGYNMSRFDWIVFDTQTQNSQSCSSFHAHSGAIIWSSVQSVSFVLLGRPLQPGWWNFINELMCIVFSRPGPHLLEDCRKWRSDQR